MRLLTLCLALLGAAPAFAQDGGYASEGFIFDDERGPVPVSPLWEDQSGRLIGEDSITKLLKCYAPASSGFQFLQQLTGSGGYTPVALLVGPGKDSFTALTAAGARQFSVDRVSCAGPPQSLGSFTFDVELEPFVNPKLWPQAQDGGYYYLARAGLAEFSDTPAPSARLLHTETELRAAMGLAPIEGNTSVGHVRFIAMATAPDGTLYFVTQVSDADGKVRYDLLERTPTGVLRRRFSQYESITRVPVLAYSAAFDAVLGDGLTARIGPDAAYPLFAVFPTGGTPGPSFSVGMPPWPAQPTPPIAFKTILGLSGGSAGVVRAITSAGLWYRLTPDPTRADFDRDGLRAIDEAQAGTSDFLADFDGDGRSDYAEVVRFHTDPKDAGSTPVLAAGAPLVFAPNHFTRYLPLFPPACRSDVQFSFARVVCSHNSCLPDQPTSDCFGPDLAKVGNVPGDSLFVAPEDGEPPQFVVRSSNDNSRTDFIINIVTGEEIRHVFPYGEGGIPVVFPLSPAKLLLRYTPSGTSQLYRSGAGEFFAVIDSSRSGCPVLPNAAARCDAPETFSAPVLRYALLGYAPELKAVLVSVDTTQGRTLYGVTNDGLLWLADLTSAFGGLPPVNLLPLEPAGSSGYLVHAQATLNTYSQFGTFELDPAFHERPPPRRFVDAAGSSGQFFRTGYLDRIHTEYLLEPSQPGLPPRYVPRQFEVEWEPVPPELRPGEVISFGRFRQRFNGAAGQVLFNPVTGVFEDSVTFNTPGWILWRTTPTGATVEWLMREEFEAQLSAADRAVLAATPLGTIRSMNASPDGRKLCLAEPDAVRTWELLLDASGRLEGARLASASAGVGCAYDDASELVTLTKGPVEVRRGATVLGSVTPITQPIGLYRAGGYWMVQGYLEPLHCVSDAGAITSSGVIVTAMSVVTGGVAYIQKDGHGFIATVDDFCQARGPSERLSSTDHTLWSTLFSRFTYRSVNAVQASMVMRPDGVMLVSGFEFDVSGLGSNPQVVPALTFHLWPRFAPVSPEKRFPAHDGFRIVQDVADVNSTAAIALQAMTIIPGASPSRDWGYVERQGTPVSTAGDPPDAGVPDAGLPGGEPGPKDPPPCGCASSGAESPLFALLLVLAASARAKRREVL